MDFINLTVDKLSVDDVMGKVVAANCGAISVFVGTTRDNFEGKKVVELEYEAYEPMAVKAMKKICTLTREKWNTIENIAIIHRLGRVPVTESSVIIAISSPHRVDSQQASQWCIDTLKKTVPIWKKEVYADARPEWKENSECPWSAQALNKNKECALKTADFKPAPHLVQITCSNEELKRRIDSFMLRKREEANITNIRDYCGKEESENCARVDAVLSRQKNSKSHLRMHRVYNTYGPYNINKTAQNSQYISHGVEERIAAVEHGLDLSKPVAPDIYQRLKQIEDRIFYLESVSPEYAIFWNKNQIKPGQNTNEHNEYLPNKRKYTVEDIDQIMHELEENCTEN